MEYAYRSYDDAIRSGSLDWEAIIALNRALAAGRGPLLATCSPVQFQLGRGARLDGIVTACEVDPHPRQFGHGFMQLGVLITSPLPATPSG